jgi:benzoyl-CoA reductase/2-hydroxyglutaryl-CoA dehydratase subunit BcrC/BadD/HgdB
VESILAELAASTLAPLSPLVAARASEGVPVIGTLCSYVPNELLRGAGAIAVRLHARASHDSALGDAYMSTRTCTFVRHVVSEALRGSFDGLRGMVCTNGCDHVRRAYDVLSAKTKIPWHGFVSVPRATEPRLLPWYEEELARLRAALGATLGTSVTDERLHDAIVESNQVRALLRAVAAFAEAREPRLLGSEWLLVALAAQMWPADAFVARVTELCALLPLRAPRPPCKLRVLLVGGPLDSPELVELLERAGLHVAGDLLCTGQRSITEPVSEEGDPMAAIARHAFYQPDCARMIGGFEQRRARLRARMAAVGAEAVVFQRMKFCDPWGAEQHLLESRGRSDPLPMVAIDREYNVTARGQVATRAQALVELVVHGRRRGPASSIAIDADAEPAPPRRGGGP